MTVQHGHQGLQAPGTEAGFEPLDSLRSERYLGHQDDRPLALLPHMCNGLQINFSLTAPSDTLQKKSAARIKHRGNRRQSLCLFLIERQWLGRKNMFPRIRIALGNSRLNSDQAFVFETAKCGGG